MEARVLLVLFAVIVVSGCTSTGPTDTTLDTDTLSQDEITTYTIDTGSSPAQQVRDVIETRLTEADISHSIEGMEQNSSEPGQLELQVESAKNFSAQRQRIEKLLEPGSFEAVLKFDVAGRDQLQYGNSSDSETFSIGQNQDGYLFNGETYQEGEEFNFSGRRAYFEDGELNVVAYTGEDIVNTGDQRLMPSGRGIQMSATMTLSQDASHHFQSLLQSYSKAEESSYLERSDGENAMIYLRLDGETFQSLTIPEYFKESRTTEVQIALTGETEEEVKEKMMEIRSKVVSGKMPEDVEIEKVE